MSYIDTTIYIDEPAMDASDAWQEYELRPRTVVCVLCNELETDSEKNLRRAGWGLNADAEFCPMHEIAV